MIDFLIKYFSIGEIISTAAVTLTKVTKVDEFEEGRSRTMSISAHSLYSDASKGAQKSKIRMQGYLWKQSNNIARDWQRRWFIIENGQLWYMQTDIGGNKPLIGAGIVSGVTSAASRDPTLHSRLVQAVERKLVCSLLISTVKEMKGASEFKFCWQVISPGKRVYVLQAESLESYIAWVSALRSEIEISLSKVLTHDAHSSQSANGNSLSPNFGQVRMVSDERDGEDQFTIVLSDGQQEALRRINKNCADCGQEGPEWASVNNGIMICIQCCGVHRSLGTHISKVRSLRLDRWTPNSVQLLVEIGNSRFNAIYERALRDGTVSISRLSKDSSRDVIISFITAKVD